MGKFLAGLLVFCGLGAGLGVYYLQVYAFYEEVPVGPRTAVQLVPLDGGDPVALETADMQAIDAGSSPIRYRACFTTQLTAAQAAELYEPIQSDPRNAPGWFDCFDAAALGAQIEAGTARVFVGQRNLEYGIDRVVALTDDGRGYVWHDVNDCGDKLYDGSPKGDDCPDPSTFQQGQN